MNHKTLTIRGLFLLSAIGAAFTALLTAAAVFAVTRSSTATLAVLLTVGLFSLWAILLVTALQNRLRRFTDDICHMMDEAMADPAAIKGVFDEDTFFDRIGHHVSRLFRMLEAENQTLKEQRADLQSMISDISHQVKTPSTNVKLAAATLLEQNLSANQRESYLYSITAQLEKLDFLMNAMVKSSRLEAGVITLKKEPVFLYETLAAALGAIYLSAEEKQLRVLVDCPENLPVLHDPKWTAEALFNILENAVKYTPSGGRIQVTVSRWETFTKIDISDTGRGIPEASQVSIFKRFYREPDVHFTEGIGIGLYLSREIISRQGGYIKVRSTPQKGSTFSVFMPNV